VRPKSKLPAEPSATGNFGDFADLFAQLESTPLFQLGFPQPAEKYMPRSKVGSCPAAHNRALIGEAID
jgi:hypothetical protein